MSDLERAAYLGYPSCCRAYLLASQGDRWRMAHGVEGRYPFLDHRLFAFAASLPECSRLKVLREKTSSARWALDRAPAQVTSRAKQPYRAPDAAAFFGPGAPAWVDDLLAPGTVQGAGCSTLALWPGSVRRCRAGKGDGLPRNQALVAVLSAQSWQRFVHPRPVVQDRYDERG